jgi:hypothetical protein
VSDPDSEFTVPRRWSVALTLLFLVLVLAAGWHLLEMASTEGLTRIESTWAAWAPWLALWRVSLIAAIAFFWSPILRALVRAGRLEPGHYAALKALRWRVVGWLIVLELVLVRGVLMDFLSTLAGL